MPKGWAWDPSLYAGSARIYIQGRPPYAPGLAGELVRILELRPMSSVLDIGCGPGIVALLLAPHVGLVIGLDADHEMLCEAKIASSRVPYDHARWVRARAERLPVRDGAFDAVVFAQSFHWFDREPVSKRVRAVLSPGGAVAHISDRKSPSAFESALPFPRPPYDRIRELVSDYLGPVARAGRGLLRYGSASGESEIFESAGFSQVARLIVPAHDILVRDHSQIVAWVFSLSTSAPHLFGERLHEFETDLVNILIAASPTRRFADPPLDTDVAVWRPM